MTVRTPSSRIPSVPPARAPRAPAGRLRRAAVPLVLCAGLTVGLTACGADPDEGTNGVGKLSAPEIEKEARTAADAAKAVRLAGTLVSKGGTFKLNMRLKQNGATGSVTTKNSTFELLRIGDALYLKADAGFWAHEEEGDGEPSEADTEAADKLDDMYVKVPADDPSYKQLRGFTEMDQLLRGLIGLHGDVVKGDRDQIGGVRTVKVKGGEGGEGGTLDVALEGSPYPLQFARGGGAGLVVLSEWDKDFPLAEPEREETLDYGRQLPRT
ncbi:lipoprotein [Streptomyces sp. NE5-10]|nr:lipoprotein [Streptomyces sp. NE5-10]